MHLLLLAPLLPLSVHADSVLPPSWLGLSAATACERACHAWSPSTRAWLCTRSEEAWGMVGDPGRTCSLEVLHADGTRGAPVRVFSSRDEPVVPVAALAARRSGEGFAQLALPPLALAPGRAIAIPGTGASVAVEGRRVVFACGARRQPIEVARGPECGAEEHFSLQQGPDARQVVLVEEHAAGCVDYSVRERSERPIDLAALCDAPREQELRPVVHR
jgi:hypothetical protein